MGGGGGGGEGGGGEKRMKEAGEIETNLHKCYIFVCFVCLCGPKPLEQKSFLAPPIPGQPSQRAHDVRMTSYQRRCDVMTSHRRHSDFMCLLGWKLALY